MKINMKQWQEEIVAANVVKALPVMSYPGMDLTGTKLMDVITDCNSQFACMQQLAKRYPSIAAVSVMDLSVEAEAFGSEVKFSDVEAPAIIGHIVNDMESAHALAVPPVGAKRTGVYLDVMKRAAEEIKDRPVLGGIIGPFSLACRLMDMKAIILATRKTPDLVHAVLEKGTAFLLEYAKAVKATGANGVIVAEPAAGLLSPKSCDAFSSAYMKQIVDAVQDDEFTVILHNCGNTVKLVNSMLSTDAGGLHFGNSVKMSDILPQVPSDRLAFGNIDPAGTFKLGTADQVAEKVTTLLNEMKGYDNFVLSSGCDIPPGTPMENIDAFFAALDAFNNGK